MTISEKVAHLKGLVEGMDYSKETKEGKLFYAMIDILDDVALAVEDLDNFTDELSAQVDEIDEDLNTLEEDYYEEFEDDDCCDCCDCDGEDEMYDIECPNCHESFTVDEDTLLDGSVECPACGENIEFEIECGDEDDECECDCCKNEDK